MDIREAREGGAVVLSPDGSLAGTEETSALESKLAAVQKAGARHLVIDCSSVGQMTSGAIRALLLASRKLGRVGGRLVLFGMNAKVRKAFAISGFDKDFTILDSRARALEAVVEPVVPAARPAGRKQPAPAIQSIPAAQEVVEAPAPEPAPPVPSPATEAVRERAAEPAANPSVAVAPPVADRDVRLAQAMLDALGVRVLPAAASAAGTPRVTDPAAAADAVLSALGARKR